MYASQQDELINVKGLHKYFLGNHILKGIDFSANEGDLISIIGRSGCGKTTFLRCLNCLEILDSGTIHIAGITLSRHLNHHITEENNPSNNKKRRVLLPNLGMPKEERLDDDFRLKARAIRLKVGILFQNLNLFPHMTVLENISRPPMIVKGENRDQTVPRAIGLLEKVGLEKFMDRYPHQLSGGQAQRVAIARALAMSPQVMLYDEPTSSLDPELVQEVMEVMINLHKEGMTQIIVTHAMNFARKASNIVIYMEDGKIVEQGHPDEIFDNAKDQRTQQYLSIL
ncbi:MAG: transporter protein [Ignavibacteria bacterium]|nr:transporter protein [Ignavibacteria bacterium]